MTIPGRDIITIGTSAGGVEALTKLVRDLPADLPAAVFVVLHTPAEATSALPAILSRSGPLRAVAAQDGDPIRTGRIYVAPPDRHLLVKKGFVSVQAGPKENRHRPAIDPLFRTAARAYGPRAVGVLLTGAGDDGVPGLIAIKARGGISVVQDPTEAAHPDLPRNAVEFAPVDHCVPLSAIAALLTGLARVPAPAAAPPPSPELVKEARLAEIDMNTIEDEDKPGTPSAFSCPDCGGVLWEMEDENLLRFRCRVGHAYSAQALDDEQSDALEKAVWAALRALEEQASLARGLAARARRRGHPMIAKRFMDRAEETQANAEVIRGMLVHLNTPMSSAARDS